MRGLRTQEGERFERFFSIVQSEAKKGNKVFFCNCGEGHELIRSDMEGEDLFGWLIPEDQASEFEEQYIANTVNEAWDDNLIFADWSEKNGLIVITFKNYGVS